MIHMYHVDKQYTGGSFGLRDVSLSLERGEFIFLTGASGAGKTTLLRLLFGAERPSAGQIVVGGRNLSRLTPSRVSELRREIGVIFQDFKLLPERSVFDNVAVTLEIAGAPPREIRGRVWSILRRLGLGTKLDARPRTLSGGEQQRVGIARALVNDPALLLADEPTGNLDPDLALDIMDIIADAHARGTTVIVATHDPGLLERYRHRRLALEQGHLVLDRPAVERSTGAQASGPGRARAPKS